MKKFLFVLLLIASPCYSQILVIPTSSNFVISIEIDTIQSWHFPGPYLINRDSVEPWSYGHVLNFSVSSPIDTIFGLHRLKVTSDSVIFTSSCINHLVVLNVDYVSDRGKRSLQARKLFLKDE